MSTVFKISSSFSSTATIHTDDDSIENSDKENRKKGSGSSRNRSIMKIKRVSTILTQPSIENNRVLFSSSEIEEEIKMNTMTDPYPNLNVNTAIEQFITDLVVSKHFIPRNRRKRFQTKCQFGDQCLEWLLQKKTMCK